MNKILFTLFALSLYAQSLPTTLKSIDTIPIDSLIFDFNQQNTTPQDVDFYTRQITWQLNPTIQKAKKDEHIKIHFYPWEMKKALPNKKDLKWQYSKSFRSQGLYGPSKIPIQSTFFDAIKTFSNLSKSNTVAKPAITITNADIKLFPTNLAMFRNSEITGEGYPFDYNQNSGILAYTPIFVSHLSVDGAWAYIDSAVTSGWIDSSKIAFVDKEFISHYKNNPFATPIKDKLPLLDEMGNFLFYAKIGMLFSANRTVDRGLSIKIVKKNAKGYAFFETKKISTPHITTYPLEPTKENLAVIAKELLNETYGWGDKDFQRDCSSTTRDFYAPFGIYLPRNSLWQAKYGILESIEKLTSEQKEAYIIAHAIPFMTLIYLNGHIMIYAGTHDGKAIVYHNSWGIKSIKESRPAKIMIGKTSFTTLYPAIELIEADQANTLLRRTKAVSFITAAENLN